MTTEFDIINYNSADLFSADCFDWLMANEAINNDILSLADILQTGSHHFVRPFYFAAVKHQGSICGAAIQADPDSLTISDMPLEAVEDLLENRIQHGTPIIWVTAPDTIARQLAAVWKKKHAGSWELHRNWLVCCATSVVNAQPQSDGRLRRASPSDLDFIEACAESYREEDKTLTDIPTFFSRKLAEGKLFIWENSIPRTLVATSGKTKNGIRISAVYTPQTNRGKGFASAAVSSLTELQMNDGNEFCVLMVNEDLPGLSDLYEKIGYNVIARRMNIIVQ